MRTSTGWAQIRGWPSKRTCRPSRLNRDCDRKSVNEHSRNGPVRRKRHWRRASLRSLATPLTSPLPLSGLLGLASYHGVEQVGVLMARVDMLNSPSDHQLRQLAELSGLARIAREANPGAQVKTLGELVELGEQEIRRQVDEDTEEPGG